MPGTTLFQAAAHALHLAEIRQLVFVHPYDDPAVISGQGTLALELLADAPDLDALVIPVGGGGLLAGIGLTTSAVGVHMVGVEPSLSAPVRAAIAAASPW